MGATTAARATTPTAPSAPVNVIATGASEGSITVDWDEPAINGGSAIIDYTVEYRAVGSSTWIAYPHAPTTSSSITVTGLSATGVYAFRVAAVNSVGTSPWNVTNASVDAGVEFTCAVMGNATVKCWGTNSAGQLGDGTTVARFSPVTVGGLTGLTPATSAVSVSVGGTHACALMLNGTIKCWGGNGVGQLGDGSTTSSSTPVSVSSITATTPSSTAVSVSAGGTHSCAVMADGSAKCWGMNAQGQLGDGSTVNRSTPVSVTTFDGLTSATTVVSIATGGLHSCALMATGTVKCWGHNNPGQLGDGTVSDRSSPVSVAVITGASPALTAVSVTAGLLRTCALMLDGTVMCWGTNAYGEVGSGNTSATWTPTRAAVITGLTPDVTAVSVGAGRRHTCAVMATGRTLCWGANSDGQLGDGSTSPSLTPIATSGITGATVESTALGVSTGEYHSCAVMADGTSTCWGKNSVGQLGDGSTDGTYTPVAVATIHSADPGSGISLGAVASTATSRPSAVPTAPGTPTIGKRTTSSVAISWRAATVAGSVISNYIVEYRAGSGVWKVFTRPASPATSTTVTGLRKGVLHTFRVTAVAGATGPTSAVSRRALTATAPGAPTRLTAKLTRVRGQLAVSWGPANLNGAPSVSYIVKCQLKGRWSKGVRVKGLNYLVKGLKRGTYAVRVTAWTSQGKASATKTGVVIR